MPDAWRWLDLGAVDGATMVNTFVALAGPVGAGRSPPTVLALYPKAPFANVGFHQEAEREVDLDYCRTSGIPVVRRVVGGGAILDGPWEQDYMVVVPHGAPGTEGTVAGFYAHYLAPVRAALARLGVTAEPSGVNDLAAGGRKVSANGATTLEESWVLAGDILLDLDIAAMSRVLNVPDEKFRGKLATGMSDWLTSVKAVTGAFPDRDRVVAILREEYARALGVPLEPGPLTEEESAALDRLVRTRSDDAWTFRRDRAHPAIGTSAEDGRAVKIANDTVVARADRKAGKLVRVTLLHRHGRLLELQVSGDFFTQPFEGCLEQLESALAGVPLVRVDIGRTVWDWYRGCGVTLVGATPDDLVETILAAAALVPASS